MKESNGLSKIINSDGFYKCHIRAYGLIVYMKDTNEYLLYVYGKYKFNSSREEYPKKLLKDDLSNIDLSNPWPHKSGGTEGSVTPFDFNELVEYLENNNLMDCMIPKISKSDLKYNIDKQIKKIMLEVMEIAINKGNCCKPTKNSIDTALAVYHTIGADLLIDDNKKIWFIEANPGVGYSLIPTDIMNLYRYPNLKINNTNNFDSKLYNLMKICSKKNTIQSITSFGGLSERYFYLYQVFKKINIKVNKLKIILDSEKQTTLLQDEIKKIIKNRGNFLLKKDIELIKDNIDILQNNEERYGYDYLEYIRNCRFFWRHTYLDRILQHTIDNLVETKFKHRYQNKSVDSLFYKNDFFYLKTIKLV